MVCIAWKCANIGLETKMEGRGVTFRTPPALDMHMMHDALLSASFVRDLTLTWRCNVQVQLLCGIVILVMSAKWFLPSHLLPLGSQVVHIESSIVLKSEQMFQPSTTVTLYTHWPLVYRVIFVVSWPVTHPWRYHIGHTFKLWICLGSIICEKEIKLCTRTRLKKKKCTEYQLTSL